jgi:GNAT superfamily N-acetyltransferase
MEGVRPATAADLDRIVELYAELRLEFGGYRGRWYELEAWPEPAEAALAAAITDPETLVLVGTIDGYPIGYMVAGIADALPQAGGERVGRIHDLFVEPQAREVGVGEALLSEAIDWYRGRGVRCADIMVLPGHRAAKNFCEENGFVARAIVMHGSWS